MHRCAASVGTTIEPRRWPDRRCLLAPPPGSHRGSGGWSIPPPILHFVKHIGFLSFGHWQDASWSRTRTAADAHRQTIELAEAAEALGIDGAFVRVHHFARQLASPFPLLAAIGARTSRIEIGTARDRHALREPPVHGRGRRRGRPDQPAAGSSSGSAAARPSRPGDGAARVRLRPAERRPTRPRPSQDRAVPRRDRRRRRRRGRSADDRRPAGELADPAAVAGTGRPDLVGFGHARERALDRRAGHESDELDAAARGHRRARSTSSRPSRSRSSATRGRRPAGSASPASRSAAA